MRLILPCLALLMAAPAIAEEDHLSERDGLRLVHGWARATDGPEAHLYFEIENQRAAPVMLLGAEAGIATEAALMGAPLQAEGEAQMLPAMPISATSDFDLGPDGVYIALKGLSAPLAEGDTFDAEILFEGETLDLHVEVEAADATQHSHAGHNH